MQKLNDLVALMRVKQPIIASSCFWLVIHIFNSTRTFGLCGLHPFWKQQRRIHSFSSLRIPGCPRPPPVIKGYMRQSIAVAEWKCQCHFVLQLKCHLGSDAASVLVTLWDFVKAAERKVQTEQHIQSINLSAIFVLHYITITKHFGHNEENQLIQI